MACRGWTLACFMTAMMTTIAACDAQPKVIVITESGNEITFHVEVADTPAKRTMGLQYRKELGEDRGMIFLFPAEAPQTFWMKNTPISLDMIFIGQNGKIVGILEQTVPFSLDSRSVAAPSQFVLEVKGGLAERYGIRAGDRVRFEGVRTESVKE